MQIERLTSKNRQLREASEESKAQTSVLEKRATNLTKQLADLEKERRVTTTRENEDLRSENETLQEKLISLRKKSSKQESVKKKTFGRTRDFA